MVEAVSFDEWEKTLQDQQFLGGALPTNADKEAFDKITQAPSAEAHPNTFAWYCLVAKFAEPVRNSWTAAQAAGKGGKGKKGGKKEEKPADDDFDPFGDDGADDEDAKKKLAEAAKKAKGGKKVVIAKSLIVFEVKPWEADTDLDAMAKEILAIEMDGLVWKTEYKLEPVAFGVKKLVIGCVIEDDKVSTDDLQEKVEALEDYVQSCDIAAFNKL